MATQVSSLSKSPLEIYYPQHWFGPVDPRWAAKVDVSDPDAGQSYVSWLRSIEFLKKWCRFMTNQLQLQRKARITISVINWAKGNPVYILFHPGVGIELTNSNYIDGHTFCSFFYLRNGGRSYNKVRVKPITKHRRRIIKDMELWYKMGWPESYEKWSFLFRIWEVPDVRITGDEVKMLNLLFKQWKQSLS